jgi:regulatory protein SWI5
MAAMRHDYMSVGMSGTNPGQGNTSQHVLREAHQQHTSRPSLGQAFTPQDRSDAFLVSPQVTPQSRRYANTLPGQDQMGDIHGLPFDQYSTSLNIFERSASRLSNSIDPSRDFDFFSPDSALSTPSFMTFPDSSPAATCQGWNSETETASTHSRRSSRRISNGIMDKIAKFEAIGAAFDGPTDRPCTPNDQITNGM